LFGLNNVIQNHGIKSALRFRINGNSMSPSINHGDILIADSTYYNNSAIQHGDVIFFYQGNIPYISRCVAVSGDNIKISSGSLYLNGQVVEERYVSKSNWMKNNEAYDYVIDVPKEHIFILSDNRDNASDSRNIGAIPHSQIGGKILYILFSTKLENIGKSIF
jgi:signal peptidase I